MATHIPPSHTLVPTLCLNHRLSHQPSNLNLCAILVFVSLSSIFKIEVKFKYFKSAYFGSIYILVWVREFIEKENGRENVWIVEEKNVWSEKGKDTNQCK